MDEEILHPEIEIPLVGEDGNVFFIIGRCIKAMRRSGLSQEEITRFKDEMYSASNYDHALQTVMRWFTVT